MAVDDKKNDISDFQDFELEDLVLDTGHHHHTTPIYGFYDDFYSSPLCVPQDSLYALDWYPNFVDDFISLSENEIEAFLHEYSGDNTSNDDLKNDFFYESGGNLVEAPVTPTQIDEEKKRTQLKKYCRISSNGVSQFGPKKRRTIPSRRPGGRRQIWCSKESFIGDQIVPGRFSDGHVKRRCSHCQTEDTPQWRMGPLGPKTLCNACGVRHKSGRLLPEYRPVASPTFDVGKHSNFHRKIMKRKGINAY